jgi:hypothetical protein
MSELSTEMSPRPVRLTRRGRVVVLLALLALTLVAFSLGRVGSEAAPRTAQTGTTTTSTVVQPGESLWAVAKRVAPGHDPRAVIDQIADLNNLSSSGLRAGQLLVIPGRLLARTPWGRAPRAGPLVVPSAVELDVQHDPAHPHRPHVAQVLAEAVQQL